VDEVGLWRMSAEQCCHYRTLHGVVQGRTGMHHWAAEISREQHIGRMNSGYDLEPVDARTKLLERERR